jgi:hypothetical protein
MYGSQYECAAVCCAGTLLNLIVRPCKNKIPHGGKLEVP